MAGMSITTHIYNSSDDLSCERSDMDDISIDMIVNVEYTKVLLSEDEIMTHVFTCIGFGLLCKTSVSTKSNPVDFYGIEPRTI